MGFEEIYPRGLFIDFEEASSRNYFLEVFIPRGLFLFLKEPKLRDVKTKFSSRLNFTPRERIIKAKMTVNYLKNYLFN